MPSAPVVGPLDPGHDRDAQLVPGGPGAAVEDVLLEQCGTGRAWRPRRCRRGGATSATSSSEHRIFRDLLNRHSGLTIPRDAHDVVTELGGVGLWHNDILPGHPPGQARSNVTHPCSRPHLVVGLAQSRSPLSDLLRRGANSICVRLREHFFETLTHPTKKGAKKVRVTEKEHLLRRDVPSAELRGFGSKYAHHRRSGSTTSGKLGREFNPSANFWVVGCHDPLSRKFCSHPFCQFKAIFKEVGWGNAARRVISVEESISGVTPGSKIPH